MATQSLADSTEALTERELLALRRWAAAYRLSSLYWELGLSAHEAARWQFARWLVQTGRLGTDDRAAEGG